MPSGDDIDFTLATDFIICLDVLAKLLSQEGVKRHLALQYSLEARRTIFIHRNFGLIDLGSGDGEIEKDKSACQSLIMIREIENQKEDILSVSRLQDIGDAISEIRNRSKKNSLAL